MKKKWNRADMVHPRLRLYSSPHLNRWLLGIPEPKKPDDNQAHLQEFLSRFHMLDLEYEHGSERYRSLTARLHRHLAMAASFEAIVSGRAAPPSFSRVAGIPVWRENDGPTAEWIERAMEIWAALPADDSDIFARTARTESPRHNKMAERLAPLLRWTRARMPLALDATNWRQADNDSYFDGETPAPKPASNLERRMRPGSTDAELLSYMRKAGPFREWTHAQLGGGGAVERTPTDADWQEVVDKRDKRGRVTKIHRTMVRAGKLRIANGKTSDNGVRVEEGTVLHQPDEFRELLGPEPNPAEIKRRRAYWTSLMSYDATGMAYREFEPVRFKRTGKMRRKVLITPAEQAELLAGPRPPIIYCKPGLPCGHEDIGSQFVGGQILQTKGKAPPERWEDISDEMARQEEFEVWAAALPEAERRALNIAGTAANLREIGEAFGRVGKNAERYGKRKLLAANDNVKKIMAA